MDFTTFDITGYWVQLWSFAKFYYGWIFSKSIRILKEAYNNYVIFIGWHVPVARSRMNFWTLGTLDPEQCWKWHRSKRMIKVRKILFSELKTIYLLGNADIVDNELASTPSGSGRSSDGKSSEGNSLHVADSGRNSGCLSGHQEPDSGWLSGRQGSESGSLCGRQDPESGCLSDL